MNQFDLKYCPKCKAWTNHVLTKDGTEYVCSCGEAQTVITTQITASKRFIYVHNQPVKIDPFFLG